MQTKESLINSECEISMTINKVHWFLDLFDELGITVWVDGGWVLMHYWANALGSTKIWTS